MLHSLVKGLTQIIWPKTCLACKKRLDEKPAVDDIICQDCWAQIRKNTPPFCRCCGRHFQMKNPFRDICPKCLRSRIYFDRAFSPCLYEGVIKKLIQEFKYKRKDYLGKTLSRLMIDFIKEYNVPMDYLDAVVPIPLHSTRLREREFNQARILSEHIARAFHKDLYDRTLVRHRYTQTQTDLEEGQRQRNVQDCFKVIDEKILKGKSLLLVDDVLTTAATSSEAARTLKNSGATIVFVITLTN